MIANRSIRNGIIWDENPTSKMVFRYCAGCECKKEPVKLPVRTGFGNVPRTAWYMQPRIRAEMASQESGTLLHGIIEADETYIGGKPRKPNGKMMNLLNGDGAETSDKYN